jgi:4-amino-4-deoxy-L-arabinose transferase-like glycosyltransferase
MGRPAGPRIRTALVRMVFLSLILQIAAIAIFHQYRVRAGDDHFGFGWEMGRIGRSLALGQGFSNPYGDSTGPTAWEPPIYPCLIAGVFRIFGIYSSASAVVLLSLNSLFTALTSIPIFFIARRTLDERLAFWSAWTWALLPYAMYWSVHWIWDTTLSPLLLAVIFLISLGLEQWDGWRPWPLYGALWGVTALTNPSMLSFLPCSGLWIWYRRHKLGRESFAGVILASVVFCSCLTPWLVRNYRAFGRFVFIRDDFGLQFRLGNGPYADGVLMAYLQPNLNLEEFAAFKQLGELAYAERCQRLTLEWLHQHPGRFAIISLKRLFYYWGGVPKATDSVAWFDLRDSLFLASSVLALWGLGRALRKKVSGVWLFFWLVVSYPTVYYFVFPHARYRHPIEPELLIMAVFLLSETGQKQGTRGGPPAALSTK